MALLQIAEPGAGVEQQRERQIGVGIDLGTTNSLVAHFDGTQLRVMAGESGETSLPSVVYYGVDETLVGRSAIAAAQSGADPIASAKRMLGRSRDEFEADPYVTLAPGEVLAFETDAGPKTPVEVSASILAALRARAEPQLDGPIAGAVITVPAYFDDAQRQATRQAAELAGIKVLRLLNEPTAAAVAYGLDEQSEESSLLAVYDLGGGTIDISILKMREGLFEVLATGGNSALGGDDFDRALAGYVLSEVGISDPSSTQRRTALRLSRGIKEALTTCEVVTQETAQLGSDLPEVSVTLETLEGLIAPFIEQTLQACRQTLRDAGTDAVDRVVLVGGVPPARPPCSGPLPSVFS